MNEKERQIILQYTLFMQAKPTVKLVEFTYEKNTKNATDKR